MNQITHFLDGSNVYGSDDEDAGDLRQYSGGLMKSYSGNGNAKELLPQTEGDQESEECQISDTAQTFEDKKCFKAYKSALINNQSNYH